MKATGNLKNHFSSQWTRMKKMYRQKELNQGLMMMEMRAILNLGQSRKKRRKRKIKRLESNKRRWTAMTQVLNNSAHQTT